MLKLAEKIGTRQSWHTILGSKIGWTTLGQSLEVACFYQKFFQQNIFQQKHKNLANDGGMEGFVGVSSNENLTRIEIRVTGLIAIFRNIFKKNQNSYKQTQKIFTVVWCM